MHKWNGALKPYIGCLTCTTGKIKPVQKRSLYNRSIISGHRMRIFKNMNMSRKLALNLAKIYKNKHSKKTPLSHIMFDCRMELHHSLAILGKKLQFRVFV